MRGQNRRRQVPVTDRVAYSPATEDLKLIAREVGDLLVVRTGLRVAKGDNASDLILHAGRKVFDGAMVHCRTLAVEKD